MRNEYFDVKLFFTKNRNNNINTKLISKWLECTVRHIQKGCKIKDIPFRRIHGRKYYIWNEETLKKFGEWYNRNFNKPKKSYYNPKTRKPPKPKVYKEKKVISFITIKDIIDEVKIFHKDNKPRVDSTKIRHIQRWCKRNNIPFEYINGRKYYIITKKIKLKIIETFKKRDYLYHVFSKKTVRKKKES